ncbi:MAG: mechanosensitive ion channel family protein [Acidobacteriota bacterium]|nr:mechanosensitive ion channel family protein [Acidobacteriota bacterium]
MSELWEGLRQRLTPDTLVTALQAALLLVAGMVVARLLGRAVARLTASRLERQQSILFRRAVVYGTFLLFLLAALHQLGFNLGVLLGAAGVASVAIGFAAQTSASNLISGLFLIGERPFAIGDVIAVGGTTGEVLAIDLLSLKLRTFDNVFVRIPNETLIKTEVRNLTRFPIRRVDLAIGVAYKEDVARVRAILDELADANPLCLDEPKPQFFFQGFGDSALLIQYSPWTARENYLEAKNSLQLEIKRRFDAEGIEIPFPHVSLYAGSETAPLPVRVVTAAEPPAPEA